MIPSASYSTYPVNMCSMPNEVIELIASQLTLSFRDVIAFSLTSRRIHEAIASLVTEPLLVGDIHETKGLNNETSPGLGLSRALVVNMKFIPVPDEAPMQSEQLRRLLTRAPRIRYLALRRSPPPINNQEAPLRWEPTRSKTSAHPFPLRTSHFLSGSSYLSSLTHLDMSDLSVHPMIFSRLPNLTHLRLSFCGHQDAYLPSEVLNIITFAKTCKLVAFEIGMLAVVDQRERTNVVRACAGAWPTLRTLNLVSADSEGKVLSLGDGWIKPENAVDSAVELSDALRLCPGLTTLLLGLSSRDSKNLAAIFQRHCPSLESFGCLTPCNIKSSNRRPFVESFEVVLARWTKQDGWVDSKNMRRIGHNGVFGMLK